MRYIYINFLNQIKLYITQNRFINHIQWLLTHLSLDYRITESSKKQAGAELCQAGAELCQAGASFASFP